jgi:tRNA A-37 threonylcarbamoyl transferase component Bud32
MIGSTFLRFGDISWRVRSDAAPVLFNSSGLRLQDWLRSGQASIVKHGPHRTVYRVQLGPRSIYIKHHRVPNTGAMLSQWVQSSRGRRELNCIERATAAAIPTLEPLALGEQHKAGMVLENYLVTEGIADVQPLDRFIQETLQLLPSSRRGKILRNLTDELAALVAKLHEAGVLHPDLHSGNVLVRLLEDDSLRVFLIDLQEAESCRTASWRRSRRDLLAFGLFFFTTVRAVDRARFLRRYLELRPGLNVSWKTLAPGLADDLRRKALRFWRKLDYRCISNNRRFRYRNIGTAHGFAVTELSEMAQLALLREPDAPFDCQSATLLKQSPSSHVACVEMRVAGARVPVIYKRFNCSKPLDTLRATMHHSPALRAWHAGHGLIIRRIPTARPLAIMERIVTPLVRETYLITQFIPQSQCLRDYLNQLTTSLTPCERQARIRPLIVRLASVVRAMHDRNISHRDMKASNFLVAPGQSTSDGPDVYLIDLAGVLIWRNMPQERRLQNLSRMLVSLQSSAAFTRTDFLRFLFAYQPGIRRMPQRWKETWRYLGLKAAEKITRNQQLDRPVA